MPVYKHTQPQRREDPPEESIDVTVKDERRAEEIEAVLDEIDEVLEENAEEFVASYVQKGGQ